MVRIEELGKDVLPYDDEHEEGEGEQDSGDRNPCHSETDQQIDELEQSEEQYGSDWHCLNERSMIPFQNPNISSKQEAVLLIGSYKL